MKMTLDTIDQQIREVENRIAVERIALDDAVNGCTNSLREAVTSPKTLLALLGIGFAVGKVMFKEKAAPESAPVKKAGLLGLITGVAGTALSLAGPRFGWGGAAKWAARRYFSRHKSAAAGANSPTGYSSPATHAQAPAPIYPRPRAGA
jgi:hypothetical protein